MRNNLVLSLNKRFGDLIKKNEIICSTILDPNFGIGAFDQDFRDNAKQILINMINIENIENIRPDNISIDQNTSLENENDRDNKFEFILNDLNQNKNSRNILENQNLDQFFLSLENYRKSILKKKEKVNALLYWQQNEQNYPVIAKIAKKLLGIPSSSSEVERMFSVAGHIFSLRKRRMKIDLFENLTFLKLNSNLL